MSIYIFISYQQSYIHCMRRFIPTKEKDILHMVNLTRKYGITCINLNQSHLSAELPSLKVSFALFTKGCLVGLLKHHQAPVKQFAKTHKTLTW